MTPCRETTPTRAPVASSQETVTTADMHDDDIEQQDDLAIAQNGGTSSSSDEGDLDADLDGDDMMDKISSSPSIEDGRCRSVAIPAA